MEFTFNSKLKNSVDIDFYGFNKLIDKEHDYDNDIDILINWRAILYAPEKQGITDIYPIIDKVSLELEYNYIQELPGDNYNEGKRNYTLEVDDFLSYPLSAMESSERKKLSPDKRKWVIRTEYTVNEEEVSPSLILNSIEIDWETKEIMITF